MKKYVCSFKESGEFLGDFDNVEELRDFLEGNDADFSDADFETEEGIFIAKVENPNDIDYNDIDYIDDIEISW